jgi:hypothetical protein
MASTFRTGRNRHLTRDVGAFQVGLGVSLGAVLVGMKGIPAVLAGAASAAVLHVVSHVVDYGDGGRSSDPFVLGSRGARPRPRVRRGVEIRGWSPIPPSISFRGGSRGIEHVADEDQFGIHLVIR